MFKFNNENTWIKYQISWKLEITKTLKVCLRASSFPKNIIRNQSDRSSPPQVLLGKDVLIICSKFTGKHPCWSVISIKLQNHFIEITLRCSPVNLLHIFRTSFPNNTSGWLLLKWPSDRMIYFQCQWMLHDQILSVLSWDIKLKIAN